MKVRETEKMKFLFLNNWNQDIDTLAYPHQWLDSRYTRHIQLLKQYMEMYGIHYGTLDTMTIDETDVYIWQEQYRKPSDLEPVTLNSGKPCILIATEPPVICPRNYLPENEQRFQKIFTWRSDLIDYQKYFPIRPMYFDPPSQLNKRSFSDRKFCTMIASLKIGHKEPESLYGERKVTADWFAEHYPENMSKRKFKNIPCQFIRE